MSKEDLTNNAQMMKQVVKEAIRHLPDLFGLIPSDYSNLQKYIDASMKKVLSKTQFEKLTKFGSPRDKQNMLDLLEQYLRIVAVSNRDKHSTTLKIADVRQLHPEEIENSVSHSNREIIKSMTGVQDAVTQMGTLVANALRDFQTNQRQTPLPIQPVTTYQTTCGIEVLQPTGIHPRRNPQHQQDRLTTQDKQDHLMAEVVVSVATLHTFVRHALF